MSEEKSHDNTASYAEAFFIGNLLFVGVFYLALLILYAKRFKNTNAIGKSHLKQALIASSISTVIFIAINIFILTTSKYDSLSALLLLEIYFMLLVPPFLLVGILGFTKAIKGNDFTYPIIGRFDTKSR